MTTIDDARALQNTLDRDIWRLVEGFYRATGIRVKQVDIAWRQYGSLSEKPGDHVIVRVASEAEWR